MIMIKPNKIGWPWKTEDDNIKGGGIEDKAS